MDLTLLSSLRSFCLLGAAGKWQIIILQSLYPGVYRPPVWLPLKQTGGKGYSLWCPSAWNRAWYVGGAAQILFKGNEGSDLVVSSVLAVGMCS